MATVTSQMLVLNADAKTNYHRAIVTPEWLRAVTDFAMLQLKQTCQFRTVRGTGTVAPEFNEERFTGPLSLVKNNYRLSVNVARGLFDWRFDKFDARIHHIPESNVFSLLSSSIVTIESAQIDEENHRTVDRIILAIANGCDRKIVEQFKCPWCASDVMLHYHPTGRAFAFGCTNTGPPFFRHSKPVCLPDWWQYAVSGEWLDADSYEEAM